jgi:TolB-like protein/Flp pilus assembly protein TadD
MELETADDGPRATALAHGMTDSLVRALSRLPGVRVVGPIARDDRPESPIDEQRLGVRLGVQYLVRGTMRTVDRAVRVTTRLVDAGTGEVVWSDSVDTIADDLLRLGGEDEVAGKIAGVIGDYSGVLLKHAARRPDSSANPVVTEALVRYYEALELNTPDAGAGVRAGLERALEVEPDHPQLLAMLASTWSYEAVFASGPEREEAARRGEEYARAALAIEPDDAHAHLVLGTVHLTRQHPESARREVLLALDVAPGNPSILYGAGWILTLAGDWEAGVAHVRESTRLNPSRPTLRYSLLAVDRLMAGDFAAALVDATRYGGHDDFWGPLLRALALAGLGYDDEAQAALADARALEPGFREIVAWWPDLPAHAREFLVAAIDALTAE